MGWLVIDKTFYGDLTGDSMKDVKIMHEVMDNCNFEFSSHRDLLPDRKSFNRRVDEYMDKAMEKYNAKHP